MKKLILVMLLPVSVIAQKNYTISGKIPELTVPAKAYLYRTKNEGWDVADSTEVKNGAFQFSGSLTEPEIVIVRVKRTGAREVRGQSDEIDLFLENAKVSINGTDSVKNAVISGSNVDLERKKLAALIQPFIDKIIVISNRFGKYNKNSVNEAQEARKIAGDSLTSYTTAIRDINLKFIDTHLNSYMALYTFYYSILTEKFDPVEMEPRLHKFSAGLQSSNLGKRVAARIDAIKKGQTGEKVTDFTQNDVNGKPFTLSSLRGKYILVDFWASWCVPCRAENPNVRKAYQALKDKNFEIVSVSLDDKKDVWVEAIDKDGMPWIHVSDLKGWKNDVGVLYGINSVPQNFLVDPNGVIIARNLSGEDLAEKLSAFIK